MPLIIGEQIGIAHGLANYSRVLCSDLLIASEDSVLIGSATDMMKRLKDLELTVRQHKQTIKYQQECIEKLEDKLNTIWSTPPMPGYIESQKSFEKNML